MASQISLMQILILTCVPQSNSVDQHLARDKQSLLLCCSLDSMFPKCKKDTPGGKNIKYSPKMGIILSDMYCTRQM